MRREGRTVAAALLLAVGAALGPAAARAGDEDPFRVAFIGPLHGPLAASAEESLDGVRFAAARQNSLGGVGDAHRKVEVVPLDDGDDPAGAEKALAEATKRKVQGVIAAPTGRTVEALVARARRGRLPVLVAGGAPPVPVLDPEDPVLCVGSWSVDQALAAADFLAVHSDRSFLGLHGDSVEPAIVAEDTPRGRDVAEALARNLGPRQHVAGTLLVAPGAGPARADLEALRAKRCDRLVLVGEPDLVDRTAEALAAARWDVPLFCMDGMLSRAARAVHDGRVRAANFLVGLPQKVSEIPRALLDAHAAARGKAAKVYPRTVLGYLAADLLFTGAGTVGRGRTVLAAIRDVRYGPEELNMPVLDEAGRTALTHWFLWSAADGGPQPIDPDLLPTRGFSPLLRMRGPERYDAVEAGPDTKTVWVTFGDVKSVAPRSIEKDMGRLGLGSRGYEGDMDAWLLEELTARAIGKLNRLFLKNYDGTFVPGVSYDIAFTARKPEKLKAFQYWTCVVAGDDESAGGRVTGSGTCSIYSTFLMRTIFLPNRLEPPMSREDRAYMDGTYSWGTSTPQNIRSDSLRCLVDGYAGSFALTGAHELGHIAGLGHDIEDPRSIMNVAEGVGARETNCWFIPKHAETLEKVLGRSGRRR